MSQAAFSNGIHQTHRTHTSAVSVSSSPVAFIHFLFWDSLSNSLPPLSIVSPSCDVAADEGYCVWRFHGSLYDLRAGGPSRGPALIMKPLKPPRSATPASHCKQPLPLPRIPEREVQAAAIKSAPLWSLRRCHKRRSSCSAWSLFSERKGIRPASTPTCGCCEPAACAKQDVSGNRKEQLRDQVRPSTEFKGCRIFCSMGGTTCRLRFKC